MKLTIFAAVLCFANSLAFSQQQDEDRERDIAKRFEALLLRSPQRGTAFDRVYGDHTRNDSLNTFTQRLSKSPEDGNARMVLGLIAARQANDAAAVEHFEAAARLFPKNPLPPWYRAESLIAIGRLDDAVSDFEQALERAQQPIRRIALYRQLGRTHQRTYNNQAALDVWKRLEAEFPGKEDVQEEIGNAMAADGLTEEAAERFEKLAAETKNADRKVRWTVRHAELLAELKRHDDAIERLSRLALRLRPGSWLHRDVRDRVVQMFLDLDHFEGLTGHFQKLTEDRPDDLDARIRLADAHEILGRTDEAINVLSAAVELAPGDVGLRESLLRTLLADQRVDEAEKQFEVLHEQDPQNADFIVEWGRLVASRQDDQKQRHETAAAIWKKLLVGHQQDANRLARLADLLTQIDANEEAVAFYRRAIAADPDRSLYREQLGDLLYESGDQEAAMAEWREIASGERRNVDSLVDLARLLYRHEAFEESLKTFREAIRLDESRLDLRLEYVRLLSDAEQYDRAIGELDAARQIAESVSERDRVLDARIDILQAARRLDAATKELQETLTTAAETSADDWVRLAKYAQANRNLSLAVSACREAVQRSPDSIPVLTLAVKIQEKNGQLLDAAENRSRLAALDVRSRSIHLRQLASLRHRMGQTELALQAGRNLMKFAGSQPDNVLFFVDICAQADKFEEGTQAIQRAIRINPRTNLLRERYAELLAQQFRTDEAIEVYWRLFESVKTLNDKLPIVERLAELHQRLGDSERLTHRLERLRSSKKQDRRDLAVCLAKAHETLNQRSQAIEVLEEILGERPDDLPVLRMLVDLADSHLPIAEAIRYQQRVCELSSLMSDTHQLAGLLLRNEDYIGTFQLLQKTASEANDLASALQTYDIAWNTWTNQPESERSGDQSVLSPMLDQIQQRFGNHWAILNRRGSLLIQTPDGQEQLDDLSQQILQMDVPRDEPDPTLVHRWNQIRNRSQTLAEQRVNVNSEYFIIGDTFRGWLNNAPLDFGSARLKAWGWLIRKRREPFSRNAVIKDLQQDIQTTDSDTPKDDLLEITLALYRSDEQAMAVIMELCRTEHRASMEYLVNSHRLLDTDEGLELNVECLHKLAPTATSLVWEGMSIVSDRCSPEHRVQLRQVFLPLATKPEHHVALLSTVSSLDELNHDLARLNAALRVSSGNASTVAKTAVDSLESGLANHTQILRAAAAAQNQDPLKQTYLHIQRLRQRLDPHHPVSMEQLLHRRGWYHRRRVYVQDAAGKVTRRDLEYPPKRSFASDLHLVLFYPLYEAHREAKQLPALIDLLQDLADQPNQEADLELVALMNLAWVHAWENDAQTAFETLQAAQKRFPQNAELMTDIALIQAKLNDLETATELVEDYQPFNRSQLEIKETLAMGLAVQRKDVERARAAARRLFGLRLNDKGSEALRDNLDLLGMKTLVEQMDTRLRNQRRRSPADLERLLYVMPKEESREIALEILQKTTPGVYDKSRSRALKKLSVLGELRSLAKATAEAFENAPQSLILYRILVEYYQYLDDDEALEDLQLKWAVARNQGGPLVLKRKIQEHLKSQDFDAASEAILQLIQQHPAEAEQDDWDRYSWDFALRFSGRERQLGEVLLQVPVEKATAQKCLEYSSLLFRHESDVPLGVKLLERFWVDGVDLPFDEFKARPLFFKGPSLPYAKRWLLEQALNRPAQTVNLKAIQRTLEELHAAKQLDDVEARLQHLLAGDPDSYSGNLMMALISTHQNRDSEARAYFKRVLETGEVSSSVIDSLRMGVPSDVFEQELIAWLDRSLDGVFVQVSDSDGPGLATMLDEYKRLQSQETFLQKLNHLGELAIASNLPEVFESPSYDDPSDAEIVLNSLIRHERQTIAFKLYLRCSPNILPLGMLDLLQQISPRELVELATTENGQINYLIDAETYGAVPVSSLVVDVLRSTSWPDEKIEVGDEFDQAVIDVLRMEGQSGYSQAVDRLVDVATPLVKASSRTDDEEERSNQRWLVLIPLANRPTLDPQLETCQPMPPGRRFTTEEWESTEALANLAASALSRQTNLQDLFRWHLRVSSLARWAPDDSAAERWLDSAMDLAPKTVQKPRELQPSNQQGSELTREQHKSQLSVIQQAARSGHIPWTIHQLDRWLTEASQRALSVRDLSGDTTAVQRGLRGSPINANEPWKAEARSLRYILAKIRKIAPEAATRFASKIVMPEDGQVYLYPAENHATADTFAAELISYSFADGTLDEVEAELAKREAAGAHPGKCKLLRLLIAVETNDIEESRRLLEVFREDASKASLTVNADHILFAFALLLGHDRLAEDAFDAVLALLKTDIGMKQSLTSINKLLEYAAGLHPESQELVTQFLNRYETQLGYTNDPRKASWHYHNSMLSTYLWALPVEDLSDRLRQMMDCGRLEDSKEEVLASRTDLSDKLTLEILLNTFPVDFPRPPEAVRRLNQLLVNSTSPDPFQERRVRLAHRLNRGQDLIEAVKENTGQDESKLVRLQLLAADGKFQQVEQGLRRGIERIRREAEIYEPDDDGIWMPSIGFLSLLKSPELQEPVTDYLSNAWKLNQSHHNARRFTASLATYIQQLMKSRSTEGRPSITMLQDWSIPASRSSFDGERLRLIFDHNQAYVYQIPLEGSFEAELTVETEEGSFAALTYGPISISNDAPEGREHLTVSRFGGSRKSTISLPLSESEDTKWRVVVDGKHVQYFQNDQLLFSDTVPDSTFPWLRITGKGLPLIKSFGLQGTLQIPSSLSLIGDGEANGWEPAQPPPLLSYSQPTPQLVTPGKKRFQFVKPHTVDIERQTPTWAVTDRGDLVGVQSGYIKHEIMYSRQMQQNDEVRYHFYFSAGEWNVSPIIGDLALSLTSKGIRQRARIRNTVDNFHQMQTENAGPLPGSEVIKLKPNAWNSVRLVWQTDGVQIFVNGDFVCSSPSKEAIGNPFGFTYDIDQQMAIRNVTLTGHWKDIEPGQLERTGFQWSPEIDEDRRAQMADEFRWLESHLRAIHE